MEYIQIQPALDGYGCNPTPQQRAIYNFHERLHSAQADDIYSDEWFQRTQQFIEKFAQSAAPSKTLISWEMIEDLDLGEFFLAYPIAGYSLWNILQACFELDGIICGNSTQELERIKRWQLYKPFIYFKDKEKKIRGKWKRSLKLLKKEIENGFLEGDALVKKLYGILSGVEILESAFKALEDDFPVNLEGLKFADDMLKKISTVVEDRRRMIAEILKLDDSNPGSASDNEGSLNYLSGDSLYDEDAPVSVDGLAEDLAEETMVATQTDGTDFPRFLNDGLTCVLIFVGFLPSLLLASLLEMGRRHYE